MSRTFKMLRENDEVGTVHASGAGGEGYTLCGYALEGVDGDDPLHETTDGIITCDACCRVIRHCRSIPLRLVAKVEAMP